jgi:AcrR family transcriptional regulator
MSLLLEHKAERRERIGKVARQLVVERGYAGLTMRELAQKARVAVPTLYNLFGSKDAILVHELETSARVIASSLPLGGDSFFQRGLAAFEAGTRMVEDQPDFYRECMHMFLTAPETLEMRRRMEDGYIAIMASNLVAAKAAGQLADWAEPRIVARHMFALYISVMIAWGVGEIDLSMFRIAALSGVCHLLAGVARGPFLLEVEAKLRTLPKDYVHAPVRNPTTKPRITAKATKRSR